MGKGKSMKYLLLPLFVLFAAFFKLWLIFSLLTSGLKTLSDNCDKTFVIEPVVSGNWFCPDKE